MNEIIKFFENKKINNVLDVGSGTGEFIEIISQAFNSETSYIGVDPDKKTIELANQENKKNNVSFVEMNGENLEFNNNTFDLVCISNALHHLSNPEKTLSEMKRVLKPEGFLIIAEIVSDKLNEAQETQKMLHHLKSHVDRKLGITHRETWTESEVREIIKSNEINPVLITEYNRMSEAITVKAEQEKWINMFAELLVKLKEFSEYEEKVELYTVFLERLDKHGFQLARQVVIVGQKI